MAIFINQLREKVGVMFGNPEVTPGGRALKFYSSVRIEVRKGEAIKEGDQIVGNKTKIKVVKNKTAPPFKTAEVETRYGKGIVASASLVNLGVQFDIIKKSGAWFSYNDVRIGQGKDNARKYLEDNPEVAEEIKGKILAAVGAKDAQPSVQEDEAPEEL